MTSIRKNLLLAVSGGIAAYKAPEVVRRLIDAGFSVRVIMTESACEFVSPLVFQAVSGNPVHTALLDEEAEAGMGHIELARWADMLLVAPATANTIARLAAGIADDLLTTVALATRARVLIAPAMNNVMWEHPATSANIDTLVARSAAMLGPASGAQACGETGPGRLLEPNEIVRAVQELCAHPLTESDQSLLDGQRVLITAGPPREAIDPVRFITNHSSGKMGFALATAAQRLGAEVTLVAGPVNLATPVGVTRIDVDSALQMHAAVMEHAESQQLFIAVAAVADYRLAQISADKIKKSADELSLQLVRNPDILADVSALQRRPFCVGFAAETGSLEQYALGKLQRKKLDMIVGNRVGGQSGGFNSEDNAVEVFWPGGGRASYPSRSKAQLAVDLMELIASRYIV